MLSKQQKQIFSLVKKGDMLWQDIGNGLTVITHVTNIKKNHWWWSPLSRVSYGYYRVWAKTEYTIMWGELLLLSAEDYGHCTYMVTSPTGEIKYIDVKRFLRCMRYDTYFLQYGKLGLEVKNNLISQLPSYAQKEIETLLSNIRRVNEDGYQFNSRCCK